MLLNFIIWDASPELFSLGPLVIRWYGLLFALGFLIGQQILVRIYKQEGRSEKDVDTLTVYMVISTVIGARLGHCLFYEPGYYLKHPIEILKIWEGGLASHGATIGILIAIYLYSRKQTNQSYLYVLDRMVITIALAGCLIRLGNLMNSEILGRPTNLPTAFIFVEHAEDVIKQSYEDIVEDVKVTQNHKDSVSNGITYAGLDFHLKINTRNVQKVAYTPDFFLQNSLRNTLKGYSDVSENIVVPDGRFKTTTSSPGSADITTAVVQLYGIPRHPAQLYEAISSFLLFLLLLYIYNKKKAATPEGRIFGLFVVILFTLRFIYEFAKEPQVEFESTMALNMGQLLSIPLIIAGLFVLIRSYRKKGEIS